MNEENVIKFLKERDFEYFNSLDEKENTYLKRYKHLYTNIPLESLQNIFSYFHSEFNGLFKELNGGRNRINADPSRYYLEKLEQFISLKYNLNKTKFEFSVDKDYEKHLDICSKFLQPTQGSDFPDDLPRIGIIEIRAIFELINEHKDKGDELFQNLIKKLYEKNIELGELFKSKVRYKSFENNLLIWETNLSDNEIVFLKNNWLFIKTFVQDIFGFETKIKNETDVEKNNKFNESKLFEKKLKHIKSQESKEKFSDKRIDYDFDYKNILLKGVPGTGKSKTIDNLIKKELKLENYYNTNVLRINIHSASSNADLMQGIAINSNSEGDIEYKEKQGLILELIERATFNPNQPFVLVLEEIQENSLNELIGDLIYLVEDSKRADYNVPTKTNHLIKHSYFR